MKYFGTDGIRGVAGQQIDEKLCYKVGRAVGQYLGGTCVVGRDSRVGGESLSQALAQGLKRSGATSLDGGIAPTPAIAHFARKNRLNCAAVITASHNGPQYNGVKLFAEGGKKLNTTQENALEFLIEGGYKPAKTTKNCKKVDVIGEYIQFLTENAPDLSGVDVFLDSGFGAIGTIARDVFCGLNANCRSFNDSFDGEKINCNCGALFPEFIAEKAKNGIGFAFDGDGDRVSTTLNGQIIDGDSVLFALSSVVELSGGVVVGTIMANSALDNQLAAHQKTLIRVDVGDKNIAALMEKNGYNLGGEQSGHYIFYPQCTTGDGILAAIKIAAAYKMGKLSRLSLTTQKTISIPLAEQEQIEPLISRFQPQLRRLIVRKSGTEPLLRIMGESDDEHLLDEALAAFKAIAPNQKTLENDQNPPKNEQNSSQNPPKNDQNSPKNDQKTLENDQKTTKT